MLVSHKKTLLLKGPISVVDLKKKLEVDFEGTSCVVDLERCDFGSVDLN